MWDVFTWRVNFESNFFATKYDDVCQMSAQWLADVFITPVSSLTSLPVTITLRLFIFSSNRVKQAARGEEVLKMQLKPSKHIHIFSGRNHSLCAGMRVWAVRKTAAHKHTVNLSVSARWRHQAYMSSCFSSQVTQLWIISYAGNHLFIFCFAFFSLVKSRTKTIKSEFFRVRDGCSIKKMYSVLFK